MIHENLYNSENLGGIDLKQYVQNLVNDLVFSYGVDVGKVKFNLEIENFKLDIEKIMLCGLIFHELITNILKYAFPEEGEVEIYIQQFNMENIEWVKMKVSDNGVGLPDNFDIKTSKTIGIPLVKSFVEEKLRGTLEINKRDRTEFIFIFPRL